MYRKELFINGGKKLIISCDIDEVDYMTFFIDTMSFNRTKSYAMAAGWVPLITILKRNIYDMKLIKKYG